MSQIFILLIAVVGGVIGALSSIYLVVSMVAVIVWKIYRRIAKGIPITK